MPSRSRFTTAELTAIRDLLVEYATASSAVRAGIRTRLRTAYGFYLSDYMDGTTFEPADLERLVASGRISIGDALPPPANDRRAINVGWYADPAVLVEGSLAGPGQDACVRLFGAILDRAERLHPERVAVTPVKDGMRFRVIGGRFWGAAPWKDQLSIAVDRSHAGVIEAVRRRGGTIWGSAASVPSSIGIGVPRVHVAELHDALLAAHVAHLPASIDAGPPTHANKHDARLRKYLLDEAAKL